MHRAAPCAMIGVCLAFVFSGMPSTQRIIIMDVILFNFIGICFQSVHVTSTMACISWIPNSLWTDYSAGKYRFYVLMYILDVEASVGWFCFGREKRHGPPKLLDGIDGRRRRVIHSSICTILKMIVTARYRLFSFVSTVSSRSFILIHREVRINSLKKTRTKMWHRIASNTLCKC